ncbi:MAG: hypothetical protein L6U99_08035 [Clostridium sp.]|nr:MAG: hypothetical protein L6U99_08035 [Clostridium sp.]
MQNLVLAILVKQLSFILIKKSRIYAMDIISDSINNDVLSNIKDTQIVDKVYDNNKELMSASINTYQANLIRAYVAKSVNKKH